jgi:dimethylaniline monooxygenase (N-oxide forming)
MRVAVIGAGPSGLTTVKQLLDEAHEVICFERAANIGGIWFRHDHDADQMKVFDNLILTISMKLMCFSDFMVEGRRAYATHKEYLKYLEAYADEYGLRRHIRLGSSVESVRRADHGWEVTASCDGRRTDSRFDAVALCSGPFRKPNTSVDKLDKFTGEIIHSSRYRNNRAFGGKRVLVIGLAESGADVIREISDVTSACTLSIRSRSFLLPRLLNGKYSTDSFSARALHYESWVRASDVPYPAHSLFGDDPLTRAVFLNAVRVYGLCSVAAHALENNSADATLEDGGGLYSAPAQQMRLQDAAGRPTLDVEHGRTENGHGRGGNGRRHARGDHGRGAPNALVDPQNCLGQPMFPPKLDLYCEDTKENLDFINEWNRRSHKGLGNYTPKIIYCKNVSFVPNIRSGKIVVNDTGIRDIDGRVVRFKDGTSQEFDTVVLCTGFEHDFSLLSNVDIPDNNVRNLYKHSVHPDFDGSLALMGFVRPYSGGIPMCAEMQARYWSLLLNGKLQLPHNVRDVIRVEKQWEETFSAFSPRHFEAIPSQILFCDAIAREIGCLPSVTDLVRQPRLMTRLWFHTFNQMCYRLTGPHAMPERAMREVMNEPTPGGSSKGIVFFSLMSMLPHSVHAKDVSLPPR